MVIHAIALAAINHVKSGYTVSESLPAAIVYIASSFMIGNLIDGATGWYKILPSIIFALQSITKKKGEFAYLNNDVYARVVTDTIYTAIWCFCILYFLD
jgi:hypothetical protein